MRQPGSRHRIRRRVLARRHGSVFIAWGAIAGRSRELAAETDSEVLSCFPPGDPNRPSLLVRYARSTLSTVRYLFHRRPATVVVTNPPIIPVVIAMLYSVISGAVLILDDHPGAFGAMGYRFGSYFEPIHRLAARRARLCLVTEATWQNKVLQWGGHGLVVHESPGGLTPVPYKAYHDVPRVFFVCTFARDEPAEAVIEAARLVPWMQIDITGDPSRCPPVPLPENVRLVGFLDEPSYRAALQEADVVVALTTEPTSAMRAAFEAIWVAKPLVVSDWPLMRELFPAAIHVANSREGVANGLETAVREQARLAAESLRMRAAQADRWTSQLNQLRSAMTEPPLC